MPTVPTFQRQQRRRPTGVSAPFGRAAGLQEKAIQDLGEGMFRAGRKLSKIRESQDRVREATAKSLFKNQVNKRLQDIQREISLEGDGSDDVGLFDKRSKNALSQVMKEFDRRYNGEFSNQFKKIAADTETGFRANVSKNSIGRLNETITQEMDSLNAEYTAMVFEDPQNLPSVIEDYASTMGEVFEGFGVEGSTVEAQLRSGTRTLAEAAIEAHLQTAEFGRAQELIRSPEISSLFTNEERQERLDRITRLKIQQYNFSYRQEDHQRIRQERELKARQDENFQEIISGLVEAERQQDPLALEAIQQRAAEVFREEGLSASQFKGILDDSKAGYRLIDSHSSYRFSREVFKAGGPDDIPTLRNKLKEKIMGENMTPQTAEKWQRVLYQMEQNGVNDPEKRRRIKIFQDRLSFYTGSEDFLASLASLDPTRARNELRQKVLVENDYLQSVYFDGVDPEQAFVDSVMKHFPDPEDMEPFHTYTKPIRNTDDLREFYRWGATTIPRGSSQWDEFKNYFMKAESIIQRSSKKEEMRQKMERLLDAQEEQRRRQQQQEAYRETQRIMESLFNIDDLMSTESEDQMPLIFRR